MDTLFAWRANPTTDHAIALCRALTTGPPASPEERDTLLEVGTSILVRHGDDVEVLLALGRLYLAAGEYLHADAALKRVLEATLSDARAWRLLGEVFLRAGNARDAQKAFEGAVTRGMNDPGTLTWLLRAKGYIALQDARGASAVAADIARGGTAPPEDVMGEQGGETLIQPSMHDEPTIVAPGLATSASAMAMSVPDGSIVMLAPTPRLGTEAVRALTAEAAANARDMPEPQAAPAPNADAADTGEDEASPDSARTLLYERPDAPVPVPRESQPSATLPAPKPPVLAPPRPAAKVPRPTPSGRPQSDGDLKRPTLSPGNVGTPHNLGAAPAAPSPTTGVRIPDQAKADGAQAASNQVLDEMSMSINLLREGNEVPQSTRELDTYLGAMRKAEGLDIDESDEPTQADPVMPPMPPDGPAPPEPISPAAIAAASNPEPEPRPHPEPRLEPQPQPQPQLHAPPQPFNPMGGGTIPMMAMEDVRRAELAYEAARNSPAGLAQAAAPFVPPNPPAPLGQGLPSVVVNAPQPYAPAPYMMGPAPMGPPAPVLPPPVALAPSPTIVPARPAPRRAGVIVVVLLAFLVVTLSCAWVYLRYLRAG